MQGGQIVESDQILLVTYKNKHQEVRRDTITPEYWKQIESAGGDVRPISKETATKIAAA